MLSNNSSVETTRNNITMRTMNLKALVFLFLVAALFFWRALLDPFVD